MPEVSGGEGFLGCADTALSTDTIGGEEIGDAEMRVTATLTVDGEHETRIEGDVPLLGDEEYIPHILEKQLIGFWVEKWKYAGHSGPANRSRVFVPWTSCLYLEELIEEKRDQLNGHT